MPNRPKFRTAAAALMAAATAALLSACATGPMPDNPSASPTLNETRSSGPSRWELVRWQREDGSLRDIPHGDNGEPIVFNFSDGIDSSQGTVSGTSGCNRFTGGYGKTSSGIKFDRVAGTRMACPGTRMEIESALLKAMQSPFTTVGTQPSAGTTGRQIIWKTADGELLQFVEREGVGRRGDKVDPATGAVPGREKIVYLDSQRVECTGVGKMQCYRWRESPDAPWQLWYGPIEGLDFEPGVGYKLRVREYQVPNPPADASAIRWQLLEVVERRQGR
ncbi:DUF4377 domain-containing protein [Cupriavidus pauculus]|uniref:DUF4377 domain-containing protein n=2 Tax=Cupriavidus pauculus TaxID=82633 RepID=A0A3G8GZL8_9BURK|nr:DUF4377 domain-containing protein [Cupriavidus pauculus]